MNRVWGMVAIAAMALLPAFAVRAQDQNVSLEELERRVKAAKAEEAQRKSQTKPNANRPKAQASSADEGPGKDRVSPFLGMWKTGGGSIFESRRTDDGGIEFVYIVPTANMRHQAQSGTRLGGYTFDGYGLRGRSRIFFLRDDNGIACRPQEHDSYIVLKEGELHENGTDYTCSDGKVVDQFPATWVFRRP